MLLVRRSQFNSYIQPVFLFQVIGKTLTQIGSASVTLSEHCWLSTVSDDSWHTTNMAAQNGTEITDEDSAILQFPKGVYFSLTES